MLFIIGFFRYEFADIIDIFVEIIISILLVNFFRLLKTIMAFDTYLRCHDDDQRINDKELQEIHKEIKNSFPKDIKKSEDSCVAYVLLKHKNIKPPCKCLEYCCKIQPITTKTEALRTFNYYYKIMMIYVIVIPLCFTAIAILNRYENSQTTPRIIISSVKFITTVFCLYKLITFVKNLEKYLEEFCLLNKFFSVKLIILFVIIQSIVLGFLSTDTIGYISAETEQIINYLLLNIENTGIGFLWLYSYDYDGLRIENYKELSKKTISMQCIGTEAINLNQT